MNTEPFITETWEDEPSGPYCPHCGSSLEHELCEQCDGEGLYGHDCGEDNCACLDPEENESCDLCGGEGGWWVCENTACPGKKDTNANRSI